MNSQDQDLEIIDQHLNQLIEHFDSVQIFATRHENGELDGTVAVNLGAGNWYSRYGIVKEWMVRQDENARINQRKDGEL